ncbi:MAG: MiaB/RimO family radical SAM methylthiotransferase [Bacteroidales bacterium]|nr:MiaB/RimO family radical SAM methylthiotransferase [Candidatus Cacconaster merdequi]
MKKVQLVTMGCPKNRVDSEHLLKRLQREGYEISPEGEDLAVAGVDEVIINTCGFINDAKEESISAILEAVEAKKQGYIRSIRVFGCLSQRYRKELMEEIPEVDTFEGVLTFDNLDRVLTTPKHYAYLKISEGCDRRCAYCAIPHIRGRHISVPMESVIAEARLLAAQGVKELIVIAQDTTYYGLDLYGRRALGDLLGKLSLIDGIEWIRIHYSYPDGFPEDVLDVMASNPKICKYIDIPLQHSATAVLEKMRRSVNGPETRALVEKIRDKVPGVVLRTTMMVGHPGEGEEEFQDLLQFVRDYRFERLGAFTYSEEDGTYGALHYRDDIPQEVKQERYDILMELQSGISAQYNAKRVGSCERVLVDSYSDGVLVARSQKESPDVDGEILIGGESLGQGFVPAGLVGNFTNVRIQGSNEYDLIAELI